MVNVDEATKEEELEWMVLFSSTAGAVGNIGQGDYAAGNGFLDEYGRYREEKVRKGERRGRTVVVDWPLWEGGGMRMEERRKEELRKKGVMALEERRGLKAFYEAMGSGAEQVLVLVLAGAVEGAVEGAGGRRVEKEKKRRRREKERGRRKEEEGEGGRKWKEGRGYLKRVVGGALKLNPERVEADTALERYGIDSVVVLEITNELEKSFGSLSKTLLFEYQTIAELAGYLRKEHGEKLGGVLGMEEEEEKKRGGGRKEQEEREERERGERGWRGRREEEKEETGEGKEWEWRRSGRSGRRGGEAEGEGGMEIAIIGLAGGMRRLGTCGSTGRT